MKKLLIAVAVLSVASFARAQAPEPTGLIVGSGNFFSPIVSDLDKAIAFYRDGLGLNVPGAPSNAANNAPLRNMFGLPDASLRWAVARPPAMRTGVEIVEIKDANGTPAARRVQDPGATTLIVLVRDVQAAFARVRQTGAAVVTTGGAPVAVGQRTKAFVVRDPDGHFVEVAQVDPAPEPAAPDAPNIVGVRVRLTVDDAARAKTLYQQLGLPATMNVTFDSSPSLMKLFGLKSDAQYRLATMTVPTSGLTFEMIEFKGVDRKTAHANLQDPGSTRMQLQVRDIDAAIAAFKEAGGAVVSTGGTIVELPGRGGAATKVAIVRDPNNLFVVLMQPPPRS